MTVQILKHYQYKGYNVHIFQYGDRLFQCFIVRGGKLWQHYWEWSDKERKKLDRTHRGGVIFLVCQGAESIINELRKKKSVLYKLFWRHFNFYAKERRNVPQDGEEKIKGPSA